MFRTVSIGVFAVIAAIVSSMPATADEIVSIAPCRVVDTRLVGGYLPPNTQFDFAVRNAPSPPGGSQGGEVGCGIPYNATAVVLAVTAVTPSNNGHAYLWGYGTAQPATSTINVTVSQTENTGTFAMMAPNGPTMDLSIKNSGFSTYWVIDVLGYAVPSTATLVGQAVGILFGNVLVVQTPDNHTVKVFVPTVYPGLRASFIASIPAVVGQCVHIDGDWFNASSTVEYDTISARLLPLAIQGYCGPGEPDEEAIGIYPFRALRYRYFDTFANAPFAPGALTPGNTFIISGGVGAFEGHDDEWVIWTGAAWSFDPPRDGDLAYDASTGNVWRYRALGAAGWALIP